MIWHELLVAGCIVLVVEGLMPFISPKGWKSMMIKAISMSDSSLRIVGLASMLLGVVLLSIVNN